MHPELESVFGTSNLSVVGTVRSTDTAWACNKRVSEVEGGPVGLSPLSVESDSISR